MDKKKAESVGSIELLLCRESLDYTLCLVVYGREILDNDWFLYLPITKRRLFAIVRKHHGDVIKDWSNILDIRTKTFDLVFILREHGLRCMDELEPYIVMANLMR